MATDGIWKERITIDPAVLAGKPTIRGLRISVEQILRGLAAGISREELLEAYPDLQPEDFQACLAYAADTIASERVLRKAERVAVTRCKAPWGCATTGTALTCTRASPTPSPFIHGATVCFDHG